MSADADLILCSLCSRKAAFFFREYSGEKLCRKCFARSIENKVRATIAKYHMFKYGERVAVAVSGGKDSISLLHILSNFGLFNTKGSLVAVTVDEGIRNYRDEALSIAAEECRALGLEHHIVSFEEVYGFTLDEMMVNLGMENKRNLTPCAYCGVLRRKALNIIARDVGAMKIATAHTLDDEVQTILMNLFRGDLERLAKENVVTEKVHPRFVQKVKPFCEIPEKESTLYAYIKNVRFQDNPCSYSSEAFRNEVRNIINDLEVNHPGTKFTVLKTLNRLRPGLNEIIKNGKYRECAKCGEPSSSILCRACELLKSLD